MENTYDNLGRVTETKRHDTDSNGTLLSHSKTYYDAAGNLVQDGDSDGDHKYVWDYRKPKPTRRRSARAKPEAPSPARARSHAERNRLIEVEENQSGTWTKIAQYKYDGKTRRVLKAVTNKGDLNSTTRFLWGSMTVSPGGGIGPFDRAQGRLAVPGGAGRLGRPGRQIHLRAGLHRHSGPSGALRQGSGQARPERRRRLCRL